MGSLSGGDSTHPTLIYFIKHKTIYIVVESYIILSVLLLLAVNILLSMSNPKGILGCGLVGFSGVEKFDLAVIRTLLWYNAKERKSTDATGVYTPSMGLIKDAKSALQFMNEDLFKNSLESQQEILMGHVRAATVGKKDNPDEAHPWDFGSIVMMHNGTLKNYEDLAKKYKLEKDSWSVDSQVLGWAIKKNFENNEPFKVLSEYKGAAAVVLYHKNMDCLYVYRDNERTLGYGYLGDGNMYISSEIDILIAMGCTDVKLFEPYKVHQIKDGVIISRMKVKRSKAPIGDYIIRTLSDIKSIINVKKFQNTVKVLNGYYTGFEGSVITPELMKDYAFESNIDLAIGGVPVLKKGNFYRIVGVPRERAFDVMGENKVLHECYPGMFNFRNFIPVPGGYVFYDGVTTENNLVKGEIYKVFHHEFGRNEIIINDHRNNQLTSKYMSDIRVATFDEVNELFKEEGGITKVLDYGADNITVNHNEAKIISLTGEEAKDETCYVEVQVEDDEEVNVAQELALNLMIAIDLIKTNIEGSMKKLVINGEDNPKEGLESLKKVVEFADKCVTDENYVLNINEHIIKNTL